jgi:hypothetical protein
VSKVFESGLAAVFCGPPPPDISAATAEIVTAIPPPTISQRFLTALPLLALPSKLERVGLPETEMSFLAELNGFVAIT